MRKGISDSEATTLIWLVRALASPGSAKLSSWFDAHSLSLDHVHWLEKQWIAPYGYYQTQQAGLLDRLMPDVRYLWHELYDRSAMVSVVLDLETEQVLHELTQAGVPFIWFKGATLAYSVYPNAACRHHGDLDLWIPPDCLSASRGVLESLGYHLRAKIERPDGLVRRYGGQLQMVNEDSLLGLVELQWPAIRGEWIRHTAAVDHAGIWERRMKPAGGHIMYDTMAPEDTLIHLCVHQAVNHQFDAPWLRNLLDVHLVILTYQLDWQVVVERSRKWRVSSVLWTVLDLVQRIFDTAVPRAAFEQLAPSAIRRRMIRQLGLGRKLIGSMSLGYRHKRIALQILFMDRVQDSIPLLWRGLYPEASWLQERYQVATGTSLWRLRIAHAWRMIVSTRS